MDWEGEQAQTAESFSSMMVGFGIALLCMFVLLTLQFRSYIQPLIIMSIIPFGWLGAIVGHAAMGLDLTLFSFFGLIALTGVVVNDSIVLVDFINARVRGRRAAGRSLIAGRPSTVPSDPADFHDHDRRSVSNAARTIVAGTGFDSRWRSASSSGCCPELC